MLNKLAQLNLGPTDGFKGYGPLGLVNKQSSDSGDIFSQVISTTVGVMSVVAIIWFVIQFFLGAVGIVFSGGDKGKLAESKTKMTTSIIGLVVVIAALFLIELVGNILGLQDILNIGGYINQL